MVDRIQSSPTGHDAFISYSRKDKIFASALENALEAYTPPKDLNVPQRHLDIFRDEEDFTGTEYHQSLEKHLRDSAKLIVLCSPHACNSPYVNEEIRRFADAKGSDNIIPLLVSGIPNNEAKPGQEIECAFPEALCVCQAMPLAAPYLHFDSKKHKVDKGAFEGAWYTTLANIYGISRAELEQREKKRRLRRKRLIGIGLAFVAGVSFFAVWQTYVALNRADIAKSRQLASEALAHSNQEVDLALLLSIEAYRRYPSSEAYGSILSVLEHNPNLLTFVHRFPGSVGSLVFSPDGKILAIAACTEAAKMAETCSQSHIVLYNTESYSPSGADLLGPAAWITDMAFSPDGKTLAGAGSDGTLTLWNTATWQTIQHSVGRQSTSLTKLAFSPNNMLLAIGAKDGNIMIHSIGVSTSPTLLNPKRPGPVLSLLFSHDSRILVSTHPDYFARFWNIEAREGQAKPFITMPTWANAVSLASHTDGANEQILAAVLDSKVLVWNLSRTKAERSLSVYDDYISSAAFNKQGEMLVLGTGDGKLIVVNVGALAGFGLSPEERDPVGDYLRQEDARLNKLPPLLGHRSVIEHIALSDDGKQLASASKDGTVLLWRTARQGQLVRSFSVDQKGDTHTDSALANKLGGSDPCTGDDGSECATSPNGELLVRIERVNPAPCSAGADGKGCVHLAIQLVNKSTGSIGPPLVYNGDSVFGNDTFMVQMPSNELVRVFSQKENNSIINLEWLIGFDDLRRRACRIANRNLTGEEWHHYVSTKPNAASCPDLP